jgi:hypothetical protein
VTEGKRPASGWRRAAGWLFVAAAFLFLGSVMLRDLQALREHDWEIHPGLLVLSLVLQIAGLLWGARVWQQLLRRMGHAVGFLELARVRLVSGLGRYIPGKIWAFIGAAHLGSRSGLPAAATVTSLLLHAGFNLVGGLLVGAVLLPDGALPPAVRTALFWAAPLTLLLVHPRVMATGFRVLRALSRETAGAWSGGWLENIRLVAFTMVGWLLSGLALYAFVLSLTPLPAGSLLPVLGINAGAFVVGTLVFVAPAGLGAKEGAAAALFALYVPAGVAAVLAVATRLWTVLGELIAVAALIRLGPGSGAQRTPPPAEPPPDDPSAPHASRVGPPPPPAAYLGLSSPNHTGRPAGPTRGWPCPLPAPR